MSTDPMTEETLRDDLRFYFMSPCEKYRTRRQLPWKLAVQIFKIFMITLQVFIGFLPACLKPKYVNVCSQKKLKNFCMFDMLRPNQNTFLFVCESQSGVRFPKATMVASSIVTNRDQ